VTDQLIICHRVSRTEVDSVDFHDDTIISGSFDSTVRFWDAKTGECTNVLKEAGSILMVRPVIISIARVAG
jgi:WD40 repeat protein